MIGVCSDIKMSQKKSVIKNVVLLMILSVALKGVGFLNRIVIAYYFGTTNATDIYYNASGFVESVSSAVLAGLTVGIVSIYLQEKDQIENRHFVSNVVIWIMVIMGILMFLCIGASDLFTDMLASNYSKEMKAQMSLMLKILALAFPFQGLITVFGAVLQAERKFTPIKLTGALTSAVSIACTVLLVNRIGNHSLVVAFLVGCVLNAAFLRFNLRGYFCFSPYHFFKDPKVKKLLRLVLPLLIGLAAHEFNLIVDKVVASGVTEGAVSALSYSCVLYLFIENVIINSIVTAIFPDMTQKLSDGKERELAAGVKNMLVFAEFLLIPMVVFTVLNATNIVRLVYMRGNFSGKSLSLTSAALAGYVLGLPFLALRDIITRVYYAYGDTRSPVIINMISIVINILLDFVLGHYFGVFGITLSTSVSNAFSGILIALCVKKYNMDIFDRKLFKELVVLFGNAIVSCLLVYMIVKHYSGIVAMFLSLFSILLLEVVCVVVFKTLIYQLIMAEIQKRRK